MNRVITLSVFLISTFSISARDTSFSLNFFQNVKKQIILQTQEKLFEKGMVADLTASLTKKNGTFPITNSRFQQFIKKEQEGKLSLNTLFAMDNCADVEFIDLRNVPGYPQIDDITVCGAADTLSMIIFTGDAGDISGFEFEIDLPNGIEYGGFEFTQLGSTSISISDASPSRPTFLVDGITGDSLVIVNIGIRSNCQVDKTEMLFFDYNYSYIYTDTMGVLNKCKGSYRPLNEFNSAVHMPVLNMISPLSPAEATIGSLSSPACQTIQISQDGLNSYVDSFTFEILDLELDGDLQLTSIDINNMPVSAGDILYDTGTKTTSLVVDGSYFPNNSFNNPADNQMNTNELVTIRVCYETSICPTSADLPFRYNAKFGCDDEICDDSGQNSFIRIRPTGSLLPNAAATLNASGIEICGNPGQVSITLENPNTNTEQNVYSNLQIGFQTCDKPNLDVAGVTINGISIPNSFYSWVGDDINVNLNENTDPTLGLIDYDNDGFFDDLPGGSSITAEVLIEVSCGLNSDECAVIDCQDVQFYVEATFNCGTSFKDFPVPEAFDLLYGPTAVSNPTEEEFGTSGAFGYDLDIYSNNGSPITGTNESTVEVEFCYSFDKLNIQDCPSGATNYFNISFSGDPLFMEDLEFTPNSASWSIDGGANYTAISDTDVTLTKPDNQSAILILDVGSEDPNVCYKYSITMDSCACSPVGYFSAKQQVVSSCSDCTDGCEILKACRSTVFRADPNCTNCICLVEQEIHSSERSNFGYTDKTATTRHTRQSLVDAGAAIDITRFLPGDTLTHNDFYVIKDEQAITDMGRWAFDWLLVDFATGSALSIENLELTIDAAGAILEKFQFSKEGAGTRSDIDLAALSECTGDPNYQYGSVWNYFQKTPWDDSIGHNNFRNSSIDAYDNNRLYFYIWNYDNIKECGGTNAHLGEGNCLDEIISTFDVQVGDTIHFQWSAPLVINPIREARKILGTETVAEEQARITSNMYMYKYDPIAGSAAYCESYIGAACRTYSPIAFDVAGEVDAITRMTIDDCGGNVEHIFTVNDLPGPVGDSWFTQEYRPFMDITKVNGLIRAPLAYCANAQVDKLGVTYDVVVDSTQQLFCAPVTGYDDSICGVNSDQETGNIFFNLTEQGIPGLGIGLDNCDTLRLSYDLCMICPQDITGISEYDLFYDWSYTNPRKMRSTVGSTYNCNYADANQELYSICDEFGFAPNSNWYDQLELDTVTSKINRLSEVFLLVDNRNPQAPITTTNLGANLIASDSPGLSVEIQEVSIQNTDATRSATGVGASVSVPSSVRLEDVYTDATGTMPLVKTLISDDGEFKIYNISLPSSNYAANEINSIYVGTTLLFCPDPNEPAPKVCVSSFSGCAPDEVKAALGASGGCDNSEICYAYVSGEVGLQTEWFDIADSSPLCEEITFNVRVKNVKELVLLNLIPSFDLPPGIQPISGSWEVSYPGGEVAPLNWQPIGTDPDVVLGNSYSYSEDALWSSKINADGLQGVSAANITLDSNKVAFRFRATTDCDAFLSGSKLLTETKATDPCGTEAVSSGSIESNAVVINDADPEEFAQLLLVSEPDMINCMGIDNTFGITAINTGNQSTSDSVLVCLTIPEELTYTPGSVSFVAPAGFTPNAVTETAIGNSNEVCFNAPAIGPYGSFTIQFAAVMDDNAACGDIKIGTDIKSFVDMVSCTPGPPAACGVFVQNSLNPTVTIELTAPFAAEDLIVYTDCATDPANDVSLYYEYNVNHDGPDAMNQAYTINFYEDIDGDQAVNSNIDALIGSENGTFSVANGNSVQISGNIDVPSGQSCPVLFEVVYNTACNCDRTEQYFDNIKTRALIDYQDPITMCANSCLEIEVCDFVRVNADSIPSSTDVEYELVIDWPGLTTYTLPSPGGPDENVTKEALTNNSVEPALNNILVEENNSGNGYLVAQYPYIVNVDKIFLGGGDIAGWSNVIHVYGGTQLTLEYSLDGITWIAADNGPVIPSSAIIVGTDISPSVSGKYFRVSSNNIGNWATSEFRLEGASVPFQGTSPVSKSGNTVSVCIPEGVGIEDPWLVDFETGTGDCEVTETLEIWAVGNPPITLVGDTVACENQCIDLEVIVPNNATAGMTVAWTPAALVADPTAFRTEACNLTQSETFTATVTYNDGSCVDVLTLAVELIPENTINITGQDLECYNVNENPVITADAGWDIYNWYIVTPSINYIVFSSTSNTFIPKQNETYYLNATRSDVLCPVASETFSTSVETCQDYPDYERDGCDDAPCHIISDSLYLGTSLTHETNPNEDNLASRDEDNGVLFNLNNSFVPGNTMNIPIVITNNTGNDAYLRVWVDWNGNENFVDAGEQIIDYTYDASTYSGTQTVHVPVGIPTDVNTGQALGMRFRLSTDFTGSDMPCGNGNCATDGEVEDYLLRVNCPANNCTAEGVSIMRRNP